MRKATASAMCTLDWHDFWDESEKVVSDILETILMEIESRTPKHSDDKLIQQTLN